MKRTLLTLFAAAVLLGSAYTFVGAQQQGGAFVPTFGYSIPNGNWLFNAGYLIGTGTNGTTLAAQSIGAVGQATCVLSNANVLALNTTPITCVAAPPNGYYIDVVGWNVAFNETSTYSSVSDLELYWTSRSTANAAATPITSAGLLDTGANAVHFAGGLSNNEAVPTTAVPLVVEQVAAGPAMGGGNAANVVTVTVQYRIFKTGL